MSRRKSGTSPLKMMVFKKMEPAKTKKGINPHMATETLPQTLIFQNENEMLEGTSSNSLISELLHSYAQYNLSL